MIAEYRLISRNIAQYRAISRNIAQYRAISRNIAHPRPGGGDGDGPSISLFSGRAFP